MTKFTQKITLIVFILAYLGSFEVGMAQGRNPDTNGQTVEGQITFHGTVPPSEQLPVNRDAQYCGKTMTYTPVALDSATHGVADVVVSIEGVGKPGKVAVQKKRAQLFNQNCRFSPSTQAVYVGGSLEITTVDPVLHNTHIHQNGKSVLNVALPPNSRIIKKRLIRPGTLNVRCDAHKFMQSSIHVFAHPYFTITNKEGHYKFTNVPPGTYQLNVWHKYFGFHEKTIHIPETGHLTTNVELKK